MSKRQISPSSPFYYSHDTPLMESVDFSKLGNPGKVSHKKCLQKILSINAKYMHPNKNCHHFNNSTFYFGQTNNGFWVFFQ